ncbi:DUF3084 domain-containing protein [Halothermothrix orenii]|uniref:Uncharacterized protein with myosin-like domain n=1 Tax=Halothermothrix orenii (strain H 168 / OCM 544 / DSM 9562) TaxID=373903 RepID=B8CYX8_HALOH|nr:DUF3084 domain-containing protein [Halothermothrix orenii]ACL70497.1 Uncharacterized protein with myosin-like domain [Halothermothrix orenii H 168]
MYGILLIIMVIALSGLIAYLGDQIGMKVGKKRLSLFGLRPKYTSIIITVLTGIIIATLTITVLLATNTRVRQALFDIKQVLTRLDNLNHQLILKDQELKDMKLKIDSKITELRNIVHQKEDLEKKLKKTQEEFDEVKNELKQARQDIKQLKENREELQAKIDDLNKQRRELEGRIVELNDEIAEITHAYQKARELANQFYAGISNYMDKDIVYQRGEVIYSDVVTKGDSERDIVLAIREFLRKADEVVKKKPVKVDKDTGVALLIKDEDIYNVVRNVLSMDSRRVIIKLVAAVNIPRNDWVLANFVTNEDFVVFNKGELIESTIIDSTDSLEQLEAEVKGLLSDINTKAIREGLLPDSQGTVGSIEFTQFYQLLRRIQSYNGQVKVKVYAAEDIWREDRLSHNLDFEISPAKGEE